jgi:hypothetical protein
LGAAPAIFHTKGFCYHVGMTIQRRVRRCRKAGHEYYNEDGSLNTKNAYLKSDGMIMCKACRRKGGKPGRKKCVHGDEFRKTRRDGRTYCTRCNAAATRRAMEKEHATLVDTTTPQYLAHLEALTQDADPLMAAWATRKLRLHRSV